MPSATEGTHSRAPHAELVSNDASSQQLVDQIVIWLDDAKAEGIITIDLSGKSSVADFMLIASGRSDRHVGAIADQIQRKFKEHHLGQIRSEGQENCDWVLLDTGDIVIHIFRPEVREFYNLEKMWLTAPSTAETTAH